MSSGNFQKAFLNNFIIFITLKENKIILHHSQTNKTTTEPYNHEIEPKHAEKSKEQANPNFPYLENASKDSHTQTVEHSSSRSRFESWKIAEQI